MVILHRKLISSRQFSSKVLGIYGTCQLLGCVGVQHEDLQLEFLSMIKPVLSCPVELKSHLYTSLANLLVNMNKVEKKILY
jgi:hypothetical protein